MPAAAAGTIDEKEAVKKWPQRFQSGNRSGEAKLGMKYHRSELRREMIDANTPQAIKTITAKLIQLALEGDVAAARLYFDHVLGKPMQSVEVSGPGGGPISQIKLVATLYSIVADHPEIQEKLGEAIARLEDQAKALPSP